MALKIGSLRCQSFTYDFTLDGGAISSIPMGIFIPAGAVITNCFIQGIVTGAGVGATYSIGIIGNTALITSLQVMTIIAAGAVVTTGFAPVLMPASASIIQFTIAANPFTAGKCNVMLYYTEY